MRKLIYLSAFIITFILGIGAVSAAFGQSRQLIAHAERVSGDQFRHSARTPRGAIVMAVNRPSAANLRAVDKGLTDLFAVARKNGYHSRLNYADYTIFIARPDRTHNDEGQYSPAVAIPTAQYAGTVFDKGGFMYVAGMVLSNQPAAFIVPEHTSSFNMLSDYVRYEGEHLVLYHNDRRRYQATRDHSQGGSHPILN